MNKQWHMGVGAATLAILALLAGCRSRTEAPPPAPDLDAELARASELQRPVLVIITEFGKSRADDSARRLLTPSKLGSSADRIVSVLLDLSVSRNRATAARFHALETPVFFCLSPKGIIVSRDEKPLAKELVLKRIDEAGPRARELDAKLAMLEEPVLKDATDAKARLALADFLQAQQNMREAIPHFAAVARSDTADTALRIRAWVDLARAHFWIGEGEKGRHEAEALIAEWGPKAPEARAGGKVVLASQDARTKRTARARQEFQEAIAAAPDSVYGKEARDELAKLPKEEK